MNVRRLLIGLGGLAWFFGLLIATVTPGGWMKLPTIGDTLPGWVLQANNFLGFHGGSTVPATAAIVAAAGALIVVIAWAIRIPQDRDF